MMASLQNSLVFRHNSSMSLLSTLFKICGLSKIAGAFMFSLSIAESICTLAFLKIKKEVVDVVYGESTLDSSVILLHHVGGKEEPVNSICMKYFDCGATMNCVQSGKGSP